MGSYKQWTNLSQKTWQIFKFCDFGCYSKNLYTLYISKYCSHKQKMLGFNKCIIVSTMLEPKTTLNYSTENIHCAVLSCVVFSRRICGHISRFCFIIFYLPRTVAVANPPTAPPTAKPTGPPTKPPTPAQAPVIPAPISDFRTVLFNCSVPDIFTREFQ